MNKDDFTHDPHKASNLKIEFVPGDVAPRYERDVTELRIDKAVVTEKGMQSGLPLVDLVFHDKDGKMYFVMFSGRIVRAMAAAIGGVNVRNHGVEDP